MTTNTKGVLYRMGEEIDQILREMSVTSDPEGENERQSPPVVDITFELDREEFVITWIGLRLVKPRHNGDEEREAAIDIVADIETGLERDQGYETEVDIRVADGKASPETVVALTDTLLTEVYGIGFDADLDLNWQDFDNGEFLDADEFRAEYGS